MNRPQVRAIENPSPDLGFNYANLGSGLQIHRIHNGKFGPTEFNPGAAIDIKNGKIGSRFAPFRSGGRYIPTLYGGASLGCAAFETIFHDIAPDARFKTVSMSQISALHYSVIELVRDIQVTKLFSADLKKLSLARGELIDCPASSYSTTRPWAQAIYEAPGSSAGMMWMSRQFDEDRAYMFFGDHQVAPLFDTVTSVSIINDAAALEAVRELGERAGITIVHS
ncbi:RES family NAD+ phosphorylase [Altererythrobacter sp. CAU 1778]